MVVFCISTFNPLISCIKKTKYIKRCSVKSSTIYIRPLFFIVARFAFKMDKTLSDQISTLRKDYTNEKFLFSYFVFLSPIQIVELFTLHLSSYFVFIYENILGGKKMK